MKIFEIPLLLAASAAVLSVSLSATAFYLGIAASFHHHMLTAVWHYMATHSSVLHLSHKFMAIGTPALALVWSAKKPKNEEFYVTGSGLVPVPKGRINEIEKVIQEHHRSEAEQAKRVALARRMF